MFSGCEGNEYHQKKLTQPAKPVYKYQNSYNFIAITNSINFYSYFYIN